MNTEESYIHQKWNFIKADWEIFLDSCNEQMESMTKTDQTVDEMNANVTSAILIAASHSISISKSQRKKVNVPWWNKKMSRSH